MALRWRCPALLLVSCVLASPIAPTAIVQSRDEVPRWGRVERSFTSATSPANPFQDLALRVTFTAPSRATHAVDGFWDGGTTWRVRFSPDELGDWTFTTSATPATDAGLLNVPVLLWAIAGGSDPAVNPGVSLPEDQAIRLARYMVARWQGHDVVWILPGDGDYRGEKAERWRRIGRAVFGSGRHAPVLLHPGGMHWVLREFLDEPWVAIHGYQSGHGDDERTLRWMTEGPPATDWTLTPTRPFINLEPPYEYHVAYQSKGRITPHTVRRAVYWSLLNAPTAGVTYGGHGVWGWDDGTAPPTDHAGSGIPLPWQKALVMPGAEQMAHVANLFTSIDFWRLRPAPAALVEQPGATAGSRVIAVSATETRDLLVAYTPEPAAMVLRADAVPDGPSTWFNPRTGERIGATGVRSASAVRFESPGEGDWVLLIRK